MKAALFALIFCLGLTQTLATSSAASEDSMASSEEPIIPVSPSFTVPSPLLGGDTVQVNFGTAPANTLVVVLFILADADKTEVVVYGPAPYPTGQTLPITMPIFAEDLTGNLLKIETISPDAIVLEGECAACSSPPFTLGKGGLAADDTKFQEARDGPPTGTNASPDLVIFYLRVSEFENELLTRELVAQVLLSLDTATISTSDAFNLIVAFAPVFSESSGAPTEADTDKMTGLVRAAVANANAVFSRTQSDSLLKTLNKFLKAFGLSASGAKINAQNLAAANLIPKVLESIRQITAKTAVNGNNFNEAAVCSVVATAATGSPAGGWCTGGAFPHIINMAGAGIPFNNHRMTAVAMTLAQMDASDQILTNTLDLTSAVSTHYSDVTDTTNIVTVPAYTVTATFDSAKGASSNDATFNCYQRVATNNGDPSGSYTQLPAAQQNRVNPTTLTCQGANSAGLRWVTLAKDAQPAVGAGNANTGTVTTPITTPSAPTSRAIAAASSDDGSSASGIIGGVFGGVGCLLLILALVAVLLLKAKGSKKSNSAAFPDSGEAYYGQGNGAYKVPTSTPPGAFAPQGVY